MTLADELRGIRPHITVTGRYVMTPDHDGVEFMPEIPRMTALREWVKTAGQFTSFDVGEALGINRYKASHYLCELHREGAVRKIGEMPSIGGRKAYMYEAA